MFELYKIDNTILKDLSKKLKKTYDTFEQKEKKFRNYNFLNLEISRLNKQEHCRYNKFQSEVLPSINGKKNNKYYREIFNYYCIIDTYSYNMIIDRLHYCIKNNVKNELKILNFNLDKIFFILSYIIQNSPSRIKENKFNKDGNIALSKNFLEYFIQRESSDLLAYMIYAGFIDGDLITQNSGSNTGKCRSYWLNNPISDNYIIYPITNRDMINKRFSDEKEEVFEEKKRTASFKRNIKEEAKGVVLDKEVKEYFNENVFIDVDQSFNYLSNNLTISPINFTNFFGKLKINEPYKLSKIGRDLFGNRLYHPFCNFPKEIRKFITINGSNDLDTIDISNSQPYFFTQLFNLNFLNYIKKNTEILSNKEYDIIHSYASNPDYKELLLTMGKLVSGGMYYDYISSEINISRGEAKQQNMYLFFSEGFNKISSNLKHEFKVLIDVKNKISKYNKNRFAKILQQIESHVIIDKIFFTLKDMGINTVPIHDAFIAKKEDIKSIENVMHNLSLQLKIDDIPFTKTNSNTSEKKKELLVQQFREEFRKHREIEEKKEFDRYIINTFAIEKMNYMVQLMGDKRSKFGFHRKREKHLDLLEKVMNYKFNSEQEALFERHEKSMDWIANTLMNNYRFYLEDNETFINYTQFNGIRYSRVEKITPIMFMNNTYGTEFKNRENFNKYNYHKSVG